ncbi:MAG: hypothetical protein KH425_00230, partial [Prevotella bivia]|nr:hypothetical protein [Prevotella bivia]
MEVIFCKERRITSFLWIRLSLEVCKLLHKQILFSSCHSLHDNVKWKKGIFKIDKDTVLISNKKELRKINCRHFVFLYVFSLMGAS